MGKFLLLAALVACAYAEPEADAFYSSVYGLGAYGYGSGLYGYSGYSAYPYTYGYGYPAAYSYGAYRLMPSMQVFTDMDTHLMDTGHTDTGHMLDMLPHTPMATATQKLTLTDIIKLCQ